MKEQLLKNIVWGMKRIDELADYWGLSDKEKDTIDDKECNEIREEIAECYLKLEQSFGMSKEDVQAIIKQTIEEEKHYGKTKAIC